MRKITRLICWIAIVTALIAGFVHWGTSGLSGALRTLPVSAQVQGMSGLSEALRTLPVGKTEEVSALDKLSAQVLGADLTENVPTGQRPSSEQVAKNPVLIRQRHSLVTTWIHATRMFMALNRTRLPEGVMLSSVSLANVASDYRVDGWGNPYCLRADSKQMVFLSSGGKSVVDCDKSQQIAVLAESKAVDSRLTREGDFLIAVYDRAVDDHQRKGSQ